MNNLANDKRRRNVPASLPLLDLIEKRRWDDAPRVARIIGRRCGITSAATACAIADLAGLYTGGSR